MKNYLTKNQILNKMMILLSISTLFSCNIIEEPKKIILSGKYEFSSFKTEAVLEDISKKATISLFTTDSSNKSVSLLTGTTYSTGAFEMYQNPSFKPKIGEIYTLEVSKRSENTERNNLSMQTYVFWNGTTFEGITEPNILINSKTTALFVITRIKPTFLTPSETLKKIHVVSGESQFIDINTNVSIIRQNRVKNFVESSLLNNLEPLTQISFGVSDSTSTPPKEDFLLNLNGKPVIFSGFFK